MASRSQAKAGLVFFPNLANFLYDWVYHAFSLPSIVPACKGWEVCSLVLRRLRVAAKAAFQQSLDDRPATASPDRVHQYDRRARCRSDAAQRELPGWMDPHLLYSSPFIDISPRGVDGVFDSIQVEGIISTLHDIKQRAVA